MKLILLTIATNGLDEFVYITTLLHQGTSSYCKIFKNTFS